MYDEYKYNECDLFHVVPTINQHPMGNTLLIYDAKKIRRQYKLQIDVDDDDEDLYIVKAYIHLRQSYDGCIGNLVEEEG